MPNETIQTDKGSDGVSAGKLQTGPTTLYARGPFFGASALIEVSDEDVDASYVPATNRDRSPAVFTEPGSITIAGTGDYWVRSRQSNSTPGSTSITIKTTQ